MKKLFFFGVFLSIVSFNAVAQYEWQDPLDFGSFQLISKYAIIYNSAAAVVSSQLATNENFNRKWTYSLYAEYHEEYDPDLSRTDVYMGKARVGNQLYKFLQVGTEAQLFKFRNADINTVGIGSSIYFNWYFINKGNIKFYFDNGFGMILTNDTFPAGGTKFNFTSFYGISLSIKIDEDSYLKLGVRNMHISNAYLFGEDQNPAFDSIGFHLGFEY